MKSPFLIVSLAALALIGCKGETKPSTVVESETVAQISPPADGDWSGVVGQTASGGFIMGNPNAKVRLIEIASLSCPFCRQFEQSGGRALVDNYVKSGKVSWEFRPYVIHGPVDMAANLVARCNGPKNFFGMMQAFYADQQALLAKVEGAPKEKLAEIQQLPPDKAFVEMGNLMGLPAWAAARGLTRDKSAKCLADQAMISAEVQSMADVMTQFPDFSGTPAFVINGQMQPRDTSSWEKLEPALQAAIAN